MSYRILLLQKSTYPNGSGLRCRLLRWRLAEKPGTNRLWVVLKIMDPFRLHRGYIGLMGIWGLGFLKVMGAFWLQIK